MADTDKPTQYVKELAEYLRGQFARQKQMIRETRALRSLLHDVKIPDEYKKTAQVVRTPILADMIQRVVATLTVNYPTWSRGLMGDGPNDEKASSLIEKWVSGAHLKMEQQARRRTFRMLMDSAIAVGMAVCQYRYEPQAWSPFPWRSKDEKGEYTEEADPYLKRVGKHMRQKPFPFSWRDIDPLNYYYWDSYNGEREVILIEEVPLAPTIRALGVRRNSGEKRWETMTAGQPVSEGKSVSGETVEMIQWWTDQKAVFILDGEHAKTLDHKWGKSGLYHFAGLSTHERAPERAYLPVTFAFSELIPFLDRLLTMKANWMYLSAFPRGILKLSKERLEAIYNTLPAEAADNARSAAVSMELDKLSGLLTLYQDESFAWATPPNVGADLDQLIQLVSGLVQQAGIGDVVRGQMGSDASGYLANQLMTAARLAYDPITDNCKFMLRDGAEFLLYGVDQLAFKGKQTRQGVPIWGDTPEKEKQGKEWIELSSKHIDGIYETEPKLDPLLPSNFIMEGRFWLEQWKEGGVSKRTYQEKGLHLQYPEEEDYRQLLDEAKLRMRDQMIQRAGERAGILPKPAPPAPNPLAGMVDQFGQPLQGGAGPGGSMDLGNVGMPVSPGQGMPLTPEQVMPGGMPQLPGPMPGAPAPGMPGGNYGQQPVTNAGM